MPPKLPPKKPQSSFVPSPPRKASGPRPDNCIACQGTGKSSKGRLCLPCRGSGKQIPTQQPTPVPQRERLPIVDLVYGCPGTPSAVIAVLALDTFVDHGIHLFKSKGEAINWMVSQLIEHKEIARNDDGTYHHEGDDYINPEDVLEAWQHRAEPSEYFEIIPIR